MQLYRYFFLNSTDRLADVVLSESFDDADAIGWAENRLLQCPEFQKVEIWRDDTLVCTAAAGSGPQP